MHVPSHSSQKGWPLAGGLNFTNACEVLDWAAFPSEIRAVDVSSGVVEADGLRKDSVRVLAFTQAVNIAQT